MKTFVPIACLTFGLLGASGNSTTVGIDAEGELRAERSGGSASGASTDVKTRVALSLSMGRSLLVAACGDGGTVPAEAALNAAQSAFDGAKIDAAPTN